MEIESRPVATLDSIWVYPVKGGPGRSLEYADVGLDGLPGLSADAVPVAALGAVLAVVVVGTLAVVVRRPLAMVPENTMKYGVGPLLAWFLLSRALVALLRKPAEELAESVA